MDVILNLLLYKVKKKEKKLTTTTTKSGGRGVNKHQEKEQKFTASNKYLCCNGF